MVKAYHRAGMEVILDVVYNHRRRQQPRPDPKLQRHRQRCSYYRLVDNDRRHYFDTTGTGNSPLMRSPHALQLITDSLRYWSPKCMSMVSDSIFAATLARQFQEVDKLSAFFDIVEQDPVISRVKLIAEPWDGFRRLSGGRPRPAGPNGTAATVIACVTSGVRNSSTLPEFASRLMGSSDLYQMNGRPGGFRELHHRT